MKKFIALFAAFFALASWSGTNAQVSVNINIGAPPVWGVYGYDDARYYYLPDIDVYYDVWDGCYIYFDLGRWITVYTLPPRYRYYDFYRGYKVVLDYWGPSPYRWCHQHRRDYVMYRNYRGPRQYTYHDYGVRPQAGYGRSRNYSNRQGDYRNERNGTSTNDAPREYRNDGNRGNHHGDMQARPDRENQQRQAPAQGGYDQQRRQDNDTYRPERAPERQQGQSYGRGNGQQGEQHNGGYRPERAPERQQGQSYGRGNGQQGGQYKSGHAPQRQSQGSYERGSGQQRQSGSGPSRGQGSHGGGQGRPSRR